MKYELLTVLAFDWTESDIKPDSNRKRKGINMCKKKYYIAAMSKLIGTGDVLVKNEEYTVETSTSYFGFQTNEVPSYYLFDRILSDGNVFDKIIILTTKECNQERKVIDNNNEYEENTKQYFERKIKEHLLKRGDDRCRNPILKVLSLGDSDITFDKLADLYVERVITNNYIELSTETVSNNDIYINMMEKIGTDRFDEIEIYFDITGGLRLPQFLSMIIIRAMECLKSDVKTVVYANFISTPKRLVDCTSNYRLSNILDGVEDPEEIKNRLELVGVNTAEEYDKKIVENTYIFNNLIGHQLVLDENTKNEVIQSGMEISQRNSGLVTVTIEEKIKRATEDISINNPFTRLIKKFKINGSNNEDVKNEDLIVKYYEELIKAFYCIKVINLKGDNEYGIKNLFKSVKYSFDYYMFGKPGKGGKVLFHSVIEEIVSILSQLKENTGLNARELVRSVEMVNCERYADYKNNYPMGINKNRAEDFKKYIETKNIDIKEYDYPDLIKLQIMYYNYGFPFYYNEIFSWNGESQETRTEYLESLNELAIEIDEKRTSLSDDEYRGYLDEVKNNICERIPYKYDTAYWNFDKEVVEYAQNTLNVNTLEEFLKKVISQLEIIRPVRNQIVHNKSSINTEDLKYIYKLADDIRKWLKEYECFADAFIKGKKIEPRPIPN